MQSLYTLYGSAATQYGGLVGLLHVCALIISDFLTVKLLKSVKRNQRYCKKWLSFWNTVQTSIIRSCNIQNSALHLCVYLPKYAPKTKIKRLNVRSDRKSIDNA